MSDLETKFKAAADGIQNLKTRPNDEQLLELYALFKQATVGDCNQPTPGMFQMKEKCKHEAWTKKKGTNQDAAKVAYIELAKTLTDQYK